MPVDLESEYGSSFDRWTTGVPTVQQLVGDAGNAGAAGARSAFASVDMAKLSTAYTWVGEMRRTGAAASSSGALDAFGSLVATLQETPKADAAWASMAGVMGDCFGNINGCGDVVIDALLGQVTDYMMDAATSVPILGWIVGFAQLAVGVGMVVWGENQDAKPQPEMALNADPFTDQAVGNELLDYMRTDDWTPLFLPTHDGEGGYWVKDVEVEFGTGYKGGRFMLAGPNGIVSGTGKGLLPGGGVARMWQYRGKQASTGLTKLDNLAHALNLPIAAGEGFEDYTTYGQEYFVPAYEQICQLAWSMVTKPGPAMFRVNVDRMRQAWAGYWESYLLGIYQIRMDGNVDAARLMINAMGVGSSFPDWPNHYTLAGYISGPDAHKLHGEALEKVPEKYRDQLGYNMMSTGKTLFLPGGVKVEERQPVVGGQGSPITWWVTARGRVLRYLDNLEDAQRESLMRLDCAYMTGREPGLGGPGSALFELWEDNRILLLDHPAINSTSLDVNRIPLEDYTGTGEWRQAVIDKRRGGLKIALAMGPPAEVLIPRFAWGVGAPRTRIEPEKKGKAAKKMTFAKPDVELGGGGGGGLLLLGAAGLAAFLASRRG